MEHDPDTGLLEMKQEGLTLRIIETMGLDIATQGRCGSRVDTHGQSIISNYECCYAKLQLVLGSEVCPKYLMGLA
jgi:hypothetical protein